MAKVKEERQKCVVFRVKIRSCVKGVVGVKAADRSVKLKTGVPFGFDHMELVGDLDKSSLSQVEAHLERTEESVEGR